ncbi:MAG: serine hydrolase [bacterium]
MQQIKSTFLLATFFCFLFFIITVGPVTAQPEPAIQLAITIDDLPWVGPLPNGDSAAEALTRLAAVLRVHQAPATGFVISDHARDNKQAIQVWASWGLTLGNHSAAHRDLNTTTVDDWLAGVAQCDSFLVQFGSAKTSYFRFPMLHQGDTPEKHNRVQAGLRKLGLHTAHVTVDNSEWLLARAHAHALATENAPLRHAIGQEFIRHILAAVEHANSVACRKTGHAVPQILLLHTNTLVEDKLDELLLALRARNVEFITLKKALADPVYSRPDDYIGRKGMSWLYRMHPLSIDDVRWDDAEAAAIRSRFARAFAGEAGETPVNRISSKHIALGAPGELEAILTEAGKSERMRSLLVMHKGELVAEAYFNGAGPETAANLKSVTKSLTATLVGVALRQGWIASIDDPISRYLPDQLDPQSGEAGITIRQLLTMSTGLQPVGYGSIQQSADWVKTILAQPVDTAALGSFRYDTPVLQLLTAVLQKASGLSVGKLAQRYLFAPLGGELVYWRVDAQGIELGGNDAYVRPRDLIKLGELYRHGGRFGGHEILPETFVKQATAIQIMPSGAMVNHNTLPVRGYGFLWWLLKINGEKTYAALGHGGQILMVFPRRKLVVLMTSRWPSVSSTEHYQHLTRILSERIVPLFD